MSTKSPTKHSFFYLDDLAGLPEDESTWLSTPNYELLFDSKASPMALSMGRICLISTLLCWSPPGIKVLLEPQQPLLCI